MHLEINVVYLQQGIKQRKKINKTMKTLVNIWNIFTNVNKGIKWDNNTLFIADIIALGDERIQIDSGNLTFC